MGACGVMVCIQLIAELSYGHPPANRLDLHLFERGSQAATGIAYGTPHSCHVLNMSADTMSAFAEHPAHFHDWLRCEGLNVPGSAHVPRLIYGKYLRHCLDDVIRRASNLGIEISLHNDEVNLCAEVDDGIVMHAGHRRYIFDEVVLCLGDVESTTYRGFKGHPRYLHSPWDIARNSINPQWRVGVLGSSLTAIDVLLLLQQPRSSRPSLLLLTATKPASSQRSYRSIRTSLYHAGEPVSAH